MNMNEHIFTRDALMENVRRFQEIISAKCAAGTQNDTWINTFYRGMTHIISVIHLAHTGKMNEEQAINATNRRFYTEEFIQKCAAKLFEFTAMVDKHYDGEVHDDVKEFDSENLPVCTPKMIEYVGQNLVRRILYIAAEEEINKFVEEHPDMLPYPTINENKPEMFFLRALLSSVYCAIVRLFKDKPVIRKRLLMVFVQQTITIVSFWQVVEVMRYPFTRAKNTVEEQLIGDMKVDVEKNDAENGTENNEMVQEPVAPLPDSENIVEESVNVDKLLGVKQTRHQLPDCLNNYELKRLVSRRLKEERQKYKDECMKVIAEEWKPVEN